MAVAVATSISCVGPAVDQSPAASHRSAPGHDRSPNVVVVVTDDQTLESFRGRVMPRTQRLLAERGTTFSQGIVSTPQCCPSRASYLTGQYPQNNGVSSNDPGYPLLRGKRNVLPRWLERAGYRTIHVGKYLNGYGLFVGLQAAPGWDRWLTVSYADYQNPRLSIDGVEKGYPGTYLTRVLNRFAAAEIRRNARRKRPFYLQVDQVAPHVGSRQEVGACEGGAVPAPRDADAFPHALAPRNPATRERDLSDKPDFLRRRTPPSAAEVAEADRLYRCTLSSLRSVDRGIARIVSALRRGRELRDTMLIFTSDNGYAFLEHRVLTAKGLPYEEHLRVPFVIRPPRGFPKRARSGAVLGAPVANVDLAPTILGLAGARPCRARHHCRRMDGRSLLPLLRGREPRWAASRAIRTGFSIGAPVYAGDLSCSWDGLRTPRQTLIRHRLLPEPETHQCEPASVFERYDLRGDPFQLRGDGPIPGRLARRLDRLRRCSGIRGRDPRLRGVPYCE